MAAEGRPLPLLRVIATAPVGEHDDGVDLLIVGFLRGDKRLLMLDGVLRRFE